MNLINNTQTMSSREIAELTGKQHQHVKRDIANMLAELDLDPSKYGRTYLDAINRSQTEYFLDKELTETLITGYSVKLRHAIIKRWNELEAKEQSKALAAQSRQAARLEAPFLTDAVKLAHDEPKHYHYSNEFNLINRIVLGMTSKKYRDEHELGKADAIRDHLTPCEIAAIEHLQRANTTMIEIGLGYEERKNKLSKLFVQRHQRKLLNEFKRLEY